MVNFFPDLNFIKNIMRPKPTNGEWALLNFLNDYLGKLNGDFEVYFQSHWDGAFPDVVILRKNHGVLIIEVKDWNLNLYTVDSDDPTYWICEKPQGDSKSVSVRSPLAQAKHYKDLFFNTYSRALAGKKLRYPGSAYGLVDTSIFFYGSSEKDIKKFSDATDNNHIILFTMDKLEREGLSKFKFLVGEYSSKFFTDDIYNEIQRILKPSDQSVMKKVFQNIKFDDQQKKYINSEANTQRKIRGAAGSGKTTVMAVRAVDAFKHTGRPVLILTFNITLCNYIRDCISGILGDITNKKQILQNFFIISHFHRFIGNYRAKNNLIKPKGNDILFDCRLDNVPVKYPTIFVDEIQDYYVDIDNVYKKNSNDLTWVKTIRQLLELGGELIFFGDEEQNIYKRSLIEDEGKKHMIYTGIARGWGKIGSSHRLNGKIADLARAFQLKFFPDYNDNEVKATEDNLFDDSSVEYFYIQKVDASYIFNLCREVQKKYSVHNDDICILSHMVSNVRPIEKKFRDNGFNTITTFETEEEYNYILNNIAIKSQKMELENLRRIAKYNFWMESGKIKLATIHSYKGWSASTEILIIGENADAKKDFEEDTFLNEETVYTGITRAVRHLIIINIRNHKYDEFFREYVNR